MRGGCSEKIASITNKLETHTPTETAKVKILVPDGGQLTTPQKRKCHSSMNPESTQHQSNVCSPAKKQRFNNLINFWGGAKVKTQVMNSHTSSKASKKISSLATTQNTETQAGKMLPSENDPVSGVGEGLSERESGQT